jgi:hypothetical protein
MFQAEKMNIPTSEEKGPRMHIRFHHVLLAVFFYLPLARITDGSAYAGESPSEEARPRYINSWGFDEINRNQWHVYTEQNARNYGVNEISLFPPGSEPTPDQIKAAEDLIARTKEAAKRHNWYNFGQSLKDGYAAYDTSHYFNLEFANDEHSLDPDRPENLMYFWNKNGELKLVGVMYLMKTNAEHGPQVGGPLTVWHFHTMAAPYCWWDGPYNSPNPDGSCQKGEAHLRSNEMLHVWLVDHPGGAFATGMEVPQEVIDNLP